MPSVIESMSEAVFADECRHWDEAILQHFVFGASPEDPVFLSVDEEVLNRLGKEWGRSSEDFLALVHRRWVRMVKRYGKPARLEVVLDAENKLRTPADSQRYVTFLAAMVLAAHRIGNEASSSPTAYLEHLRGVFNIPRQTGDKDRPWGLADYQEENVWQFWNRWLSQQGKKITAQPSRRKYRYINYPLSQTLLRDGDCNWLARRFWEEVRSGYLSRTYDCEMVLGWMQAHRSKFPRARLWQALDHPEQQLRYEATVAAIFDVYSSVDWDAELVEDESEHVERSVRRLTAGLYREEDPFTGDVAYSIYIRQPKGLDGRGLQVSLGGVEGGLRPERPGWFAPLLWGPSPPPPSLTLKVITADSPVRQIIFPDRDFWVLIGDPLAGGTGAFASWAFPPLPEQPFVTLCRPYLRELLEGLRSQQVLDWEGQPVDLGDGTWLEYRGCRVPSPPRRLRLHEFGPVEQALIKKIRPQPGGAIHLVGGLCAPDQQQGWMQGYLPQVVLEAPSGSAEVTVLNLQTGQSEPAHRVRANDPIELPTLTPGFYRIEAALMEGAGSEERRRPLPSVNLSVRSWESLECAALGSECE